MMKWGISQRGRSRKTGCLYNYGQYQAKKKKKKDWTIVYWLSGKVPFQYRHVRSRTKNKVMFFIQNSSIIKGKKHHFVKKELLNTENVVRND